MQPKFERGFPIRGSASPHPPVVVTWDDGPNADVPLSILSLANQYPTSEIEFFWSGANLIRRTVLQDLNVKFVDDLPRIADARPLDWIAWMDRKRHKRKRLEWLKTILDPVAIALCRDIRKRIGRFQLDEIIGYHGITHEYSRSSAHPIQLSSEALIRELTFFEMLIQAAFELPTFRLRKGRTPYGSGMRFALDNAAKKYEHAYPALQRDAKRFNDRFVWCAWEADTEDYRNGGDFDEGPVLDKALSFTERRPTHPVRVLMHERVYARAPQTLPRVFQYLYGEQQRVDAEEDRLFLDGEKCRLELGRRWSVQRLDSLLSRAQQVSDAGDRLVLMAREFLRENTPFLFEDELIDIPKDTMRVRLASFDCISFVLTAIALSSARNTRHFVQRLRNIMYTDSGVGDQYRINYTTNSIHRMLELGYIREITSSICSHTATRARIVPRHGLLPDGNPFLRHLSSPGGDWNIGEPSSLTYVPTELVGRSEGYLRNGDVVFLVTARPVEEYPGLVGHAVVAFRPTTDSGVLVLHASKTPLGTAIGPRAGVSLSTHWDSGRNALRDDNVWRPLGRYVQDNPQRWVGIAVFRPIIEP